MRSLVSFFTLSIILLIPYSAIAQAPGDILWEASFGGSEEEGFLNFQKTPDGGFVLCGYTESFGPVVGNRSLWVVKTDSTGTEEWTQVLGTDGDHADDICVASTGGYVVAGVTYSLAAGLKDAWLLKLDEDGNLEWDNQYISPTSTARGIAVIENSDGDYVMAGYIYDLTGTMDVLLVKVAPDGSTIWKKTLGSSGADWGEHLIQVSDGGYVITGSTTSIGAGEEDLMLMKADADGNLLWMEAYGAADDDRGFAVRELTDGGFIIGGMTETGPGIHNADGWLVRTDSSGLLLWDQSFAHPDGNWDQVNDVRVADDGGFILCGFVNNASNAQFWVSKTDEDGVLDWTGIYSNPGLGGDIGHAVLQLDNGSYMAAGTGSELGFNTGHGWLLNISDGLDTGTISAALTCSPSSGTVPFDTQMAASLENLYTGQSRRIAARIDVTLASGSNFPSWRAGFTNVAAGGSYLANWVTTIPALGTVIGDNSFTLVAEDVTPAPYNQPPYPASGDEYMDSCLVTGIAP